MEFNIVDFLPKYPSIEENNNGTYNENFNLSIYKKKEFYEERLTAFEDFPTSSGMLLKHQKIISRFLSSYTPYDQLLLVHEMGTGKTCSAIGAIEKIKNENNSFTGALILARGKNILGNFKDELLFKCTDGRYIPENFNNLTDNEKIHRTRKMIEPYYNLRTFKTFAKEIQNSPDEIIINNYSNKIIVIDEIHNIRIKNKDAEDLDTYREINRFLHIVKNCKILLMSGTPMKDDPSEIADVMNLILPLDKQFTGNFSEEYMVEKNGIMTIKKDKVDELKDKFTGRISYLKASSSQVQKNFVGVSIGTLKYFKVFPTIMQEFQSEKYIEAYNKDVNIEQAEYKQSGIYENSSQAILFVFPDGSYGKKGYNKYIELKTSKITSNKIFSFRDNSFTSLFKNLKTDREKINKLKEFSIKYAAIIENILLAEEQGKSCFIYNELVHGSGSLLFSLILQDIFGFSKSSGVEPANSKRRRFGLLIGGSTKKNEIRQIISRFNKPDNMHGEVIRLIIGSSIVSEGITLKNVQVEHIVTPHWNYSETSQAISRGWRFGSHEDLLRAGIIPTLDIYQHVSLSSENNMSNSVDLLKYEISEKKDVSIKNIEHVIKKAAVDCALNYDRNYVPGYDNERDCEYGKCRYKCYDISRNLIGNLQDSDIDLSTYNIYYSEVQISKMVKLISGYFRNNFETTLEILQTLPEVQKYSDFEIITALRNIINNNIIVKNRFGFPSYLREKNNVYFLVNYIHTENKYLFSYYNKNPIIKDKKDFSTIVYSKIVDRIFHNSSIDTLKYYIPLLSLETQNYLLENTIISKYFETDKPVIDLLLNYYEPHFTQIDNIYITNFLPTKKYLDEEDFTWKDYNNDEGVEEEKSSFDEEKEKLYMFSGLYKNNTFAIKNLKQKKILPKADDKRVNTGQDCVTTDKKYLCEIIIKYADLPIDEENFSYIKLDKEHLIENIKKNKYVNTLFEPQQLEEFDINKLRKILYWAIQTRQDICSNLEIWFKSQNLVRY